MKITKIILSIIIILGALCTGLRRYAGGFSQLSIEEKDMGPYTFAYLPFTGSYYKVGPTMDGIQKALETDGITSEIGLGIYFDDPATTPADQLRSEVGSIIEKNDISKLKKNNKNYLIKKIPSMKSVVATFPIKNDLSFMIGPMKAYPLMTKYMTEKKYNPVVEGMELYDMKNKVTYYFAKIQEAK